MKTTFFLFLSLFLLFNFPAEAQSYKSGLTKTVNTINSILYQTKMVRFTNQDYDMFYPTKINANLQGAVFCIDSLAGEDTKSNRIIFNLLKVKSFVISGNEIRGIGQDQGPIVSIFLGNSQNQKALKKELDALWFLCRLYSEEDPKFKCD